MRFHPPVLLLVIVALFLSLSRAFAQTTLTAETPKSLEEALNRVDWDTEMRGVLLVISPRQIEVKESLTTPGASRFVTPRINVPHPPPGPNGYTPASLEGYYAITARRFGAVTVLAPETMDTINMRPAPPDFDQDRETNVIVQDFLPTLTEAQWQQIGSTQGLAYGGLTREQQAAFERIVPNPLRYQRTHGFDPADPEVTLSEAERKNIRLAIRLETMVNAPLSQGKGIMPIQFNKNWIYRGGIRITDSNQYAFRATQFGRLMLLPTPIRPKPGDLDFAAFNRPVPLIPPTPGKAMTVADLLPPLRVATGVNLIADRRLLSLPVWVRGESAPAGDVLRALAFALHATYRRIGPTPEGQYLYILCFDRDGMAVQQSYANEWLTDARRTREEANRQGDERIRRQNILRYLSFASDERVKLTPEIIRQLLSVKQQSTYLELPLSALPTDQQSYLLGEAERNLKDEFAVNTERIAVGVNLWLTFILPGVGEVSQIPLQDIRSLFPPEPPTPMTMTPSPALFVYAETGEQARHLVAVAAARKISALYVRTSETEAGREALNTAVAAGKSSKVPIYAAVSLLRPENSPASLPRDINVRGETTSQTLRRRRWKEDGPDWLVPDDAAVLANRSTHVKQIAGVPGLAGIVLLDTLPPGYRERTPSFRGNPDPLLDGSTLDLGYHLSHRLTFLREKGADPLDVLSSQIYQPRNLRYFPNNPIDDPVTKDWVVWRNDRGMAFLEAIRKAVRTTAPTLPMQFYGEVQHYEQRDRYHGSPVLVSIPDDKPLPLLFQVYGFRMTEKTSPAEKMRPAGGRIQMVFRAPEAKPELLSRIFAEFAARYGDGWDGRVLDLSHLDVPQIEATLERMIQEAHAAEKINRP